MLIKFATRNERDTVLVSIKYTVYRGHMHIGELLLIGIDGSLCSMPRDGQRSNIS